MKDEMFARAPIMPLAFAPLPTGAVRPEGWLHDQLRLMADTITGKLDEVWPDVGADSAWLGGEGEAWERMPYWLDGLTPLAYQLRDKALMAKVEGYHRRIMELQAPDGYLGPRQNADWWPRAVWLKAIWSYFSATGSREALSSMLRVTTYMHAHIKDEPLAHWGRARGLEFFVTLMPLYRLTGRRYLLSLMDTILAQSLDWTSGFAGFRYIKPTASMLPWGELRLADTSDPYHATHVVNNAMALKYPALHYALTGNVKAADAGLPWDKLMRYHGGAHGLFNGDEHLAGQHPAQGVETCAVVEAMHSLEHLFSLTGHAQWGDRLERIAFNALPAAISADGWKHPYLQQANEIMAGKGGHPYWYNDGGFSSAYGIESNYGCCTANMHQGWPKFAASLWMAAAGDAGHSAGLCALSYAPCRVAWKHADGTVQLRVTGGYPFEEKVGILVSMKQEEARFSLRLRIPAWAEGAAVSAGDEACDAPAGGFAVIDRVWRDGDVVTLSLPMAPRVETGYRQSATVLCGPLVMALKLNETWRESHEDEKGLGIWHIDTGDEWRYALAADKPITLAKTPKKTEPKAFKQAEHRAVEAQLALISWGRKGDDVASLPVRPQAAEDKLVTARLVPYGDTTLRISQFPAARLVENPGALKD